MQYLGTWYSHIYHTRNLANRHVMVDTCAKKYDNHVKKMEVMLWILVFCCAALNLFIKTKILTNKELSCFKCLRC